MFSGLWVFLKTRTFLIKASFWWHREKSPNEKSCWKILKFLFTLEQAKPNPT